MYLYYEVVIDVLHQIQICGDDEVTMNQIIGDIQYSIRQKDNEFVQLDSIFQAYESGGDCWICEHERV